MRRRLRHRNLAGIATEELPLLATMKLLDAVEKVEYSAGRDAVLDDLERAIAVVQEIRARGLQTELHIEGERT